MRKIKVCKIGNSLGVRLPSEMVKNLGIREGDTLYAVRDSTGVKLSVMEPSIREAFEEGRKSYRNALRKLADR